MNTAEPSSIFQLTATDVLRKWVRGIYLAWLLLFMLPTTGRAANLCGALRNCRCGIRIVSWRVFGTPGQEFRYDGDRFVIPRIGVIELEADRGSNVIIAAVPNSQPMQIILMRGERTMEECDKFAACRVWLPELPTPREPTRKE